MTDLYLPHASTTSLNSTFPSLTLCPQCIYRPLPYLPLSLFCQDKQKSSNLFHNLPSPGYSLALSCTCSHLNLSFLSMSHWSGTCCSQCLALTHTGRSIAMLFFFFRKLLVSQKNLWAVNSLQSLSPAVPNLVQLVVLPQVSCMSSGISLHLSVSQFLICRSKQMLPFLSALSGRFGVDALTRWDWLCFYSWGAATMISAQVRPAMQCIEQKETQWFLPLCSL